MQQYGKAAVPALPPGDPFSLLRRWTPKSNPNPNPNPNPDPNPNPNPNPNPFSLLRSPAIEGDFLRARAAALHTFLQQLAASPLTATAAETRAFLDTEARHAPSDEELALTLTLTSP